MVAVTRHLVHREVRIRKSDVRSRNTRVEVESPFEILDGDCDVGRLQRLELELPLSERAKRIETGSFTPSPPARQRRLVSHDFNWCDEAISPFRHSLDVRRVGSIIAERLAQI